MNDYSPALRSPASLWSPNPRLTNLFIVLVLCLVGPPHSRPAVPREPTEIRFSIANPLPFERPAEPVTCGLPLPRGFVAHPAELTLSGPGDERLPAQIVPTSVYGDGSPRWVLVDFQPSLPAAKRAVYRLTKGEREAPRALLETQLNDGRAVIDTGTARFEVDTENFRLFTRVTVMGKRLINSDHRSGIRLLEHDSDIRETRVAHVEFEDAGPMSTVLALRGDLVADSGASAANFVCRMRFYAGKSEVRIRFTLHNPEAHHHPGNTWDLGAEGSVCLEDLSLVLNLVEGRWTPRVGAELGRPPTTASKLYQDSSGGPRWDSLNHVTANFKVPTRFRGYRVYFGEAQVADGRRANGGWLHVRGPSGGLAVGVREFWQNFPKALEFRETALRIGLWPGEFAAEHEILGGEQKTHEILLVFHDATTTDASVQRRMEAFQNPLYALPDRQSLGITRAFWPTGPLDRDAHPLIERTCDTFVVPVGKARASVMSQWELIDEYGWRHFGDTLADNETSPATMVRDFPEHFVGGRPISHYGNEYDVAYTVLLQGLRRADPDWMWLADILCRHYADICIYHTDRDGSRAYAHGPFTHTTHDTAAFRSTHRMYPSEAKRYGLQYNSGGPNAGHCYVASLAQHYYLTGDRTSREAFLEVADWTVHSPWFTEQMMGDKRGIGNFLMTHVYAYQLTRDPKYYRAAVRMLNLAQKPFEGLGATLFVKAGGRFLDLKLENDEMDADYHQALVRLLAFGDHYLSLPDDKPKSSLEQTCFYSELLFTCYLHAPPEHPNREAYFAKGMALMEHARDRWPGTYQPVKTLVMCFGNTGAFFKALDTRSSADVHSPDL